MEFDSGGDGSHYDKDNMSDKKAKTIIIGLLLLLIALSLTAYLLS